MSCEFCEPYHQKLIEGENGFCAITKNGELIVYPKAEGVNSVKIKIKRCPMCGRDFGQQESNAEIDTLASKCRSLRVMNAKAQEEIATLKENQRWRKCSEGFPEEGIEVFVTNGIDCGISEWRGDHWNDDPFCGYTVCDIIAWMPMPKAPAEKEH